MAKRIFIYILFAGAVGAALACGQEGARGGGDPSQPAASEPEKHAAPGALAGSHADWCEEHQVPESLCTRCNPSLVPAFKATGDWCEEHGLPESQCRLCNPDLRIVRPAEKRGG